MSRLSRSVVLALALGLVAGAVAPVAKAADPRCPKHQGELARSAGGVVWTGAGNLYVCTAYYGDPPVSRKIGPWTKQSKLAFDGSTVVWTVRKAAADGAKSDVIYAADGPYGTWLKGVRPTTGPTGTLDTRVSRLQAYGQTVAWVTTKGTVMMGAQSPADDPQLVGAGTPGAAAPVVPGVTDLPNLTAGDVLSYPQGLRDPLKAVGRRVLIGRWAALKGPEFSDTLSITNVDGDGDECGGAATNRVTVEPVAGQPRVGAQWTSSWTSTSVSCTS